MEKIIPNQINIPHFYEKKRIPGKIEKNLNIECSTAYCINREIVKTNTVELRRKFLSEPRRDVKQKKKGKSCSIHHMNHALILVWEILSHGGTPQVLPNP